MKFYLLFIILFSNTVLASMQPYINPFISSSQANHFAISSTTGIVIPVENAMTYPTLQATTWEIKTEQVDSSTDLLLKLQTGEMIDSQQLASMIALEGISDFTDTLSTTVVRSLLKTVSNNSLKQINNKLSSKVITKGVKSTFLRRISSRAGMAGGAVSAYGAYLFGYGNLKSANRSMVASTVSYGAYAVGGAYLGATALLPAATSVAGMIGATASTGTAISGLSGAALTNATLAWLGGGTLASGGGGMAAGTALLTTISATGMGLVAVGIGVGVTYLYTLSDAKTERRRVAYLLSAVRKDLN
ncbi:hypothetical protein QUF74_01580 [Candidatus Halobeggiatoa sp. HSG11]|nr:hypothetical protein [Candidatus Halobeggiatoa sp. HSG11]